MFRSPDSRRTDGRGERKGEAGDVENCRNIQKDGDERVGAGVKNPGQIDPLGQAVWKEARRRGREEHLETESELAGAWQSLPHDCRLPPREIHARNDVRKSALVHRRAQLRGFLELIANGGRRVRDVPNPIVATVCSVTVILRLSSILSRAPTRPSPLADSRSSGDKRWATRFKRCVAASRSISAGVFTTAPVFTLLSSVRRSRSNWRRSLGAVSKSLAAGIGSPAELMTYT